MKVCNFELDLISFCFEGNAETMVSVFFSDFVDLVEAVAEFFCRLIKIGAGGIIAALTGVSFFLVSAVLIITFFFGSIICGGFGAISSSNTAGNLL